MREPGEVAVAPLLPDQHAGPVPPAALRDGGQPQLAPAALHPQQIIQRLRGDPQHLAAAGQQQHGVPGGVVAEHPQRGAVQAPEQAVDLAAQLRIGVQAAAEQVRPLGRARVLVDPHPAAGGAAQRVLALVGGGDQLGPADVGDRATGPVGPVLTCGGAVGDQHRGAGLDPHPVQVDVPAEQGGQLLGLQHGAGARQAGVVVEELQGGGGRLHHRTSWSRGCGVSSSCSAVRCSMIQRE